MKYINGHDIAESRPVGQLLGGDVGLPDRQKPRGKQFFIGLGVGLFLRYCKVTNVISKTQKVFYSPVLQAYM
jgi:hypothetical protein